jgi:hypothetical protein
MSDLHSLSLLLPLLASSAASMAAEGTPKRRRSWGPESVALAAAIDKRVPIEEALVAEAKDLLLKLPLQEVKQKRSAYCAVAYNQLAKLLGSEYQPISYQTDFRTLRDKAPEQSFVKATTYVLFWTPD